MPIPLGTVLCPGVDHLLILIDRAFPLSQPRILAPQANLDLTWPHVEKQGLLCLKETFVGSEAGERVAEHINWAIDLLNLTTDSRRSEFEREFSSHWNHRATKNRRFSTVLSLLRPEGPSRETVWFADITNRRAVVAENKTALMAWLHNAGLNSSEKLIVPGWIEWMSRPWQPAEFPEFGRDVIKTLPQQVARKVLQSGRDGLIICGAQTITGPVLVATILQGAAVKDLRRGFRNISRVPNWLIENSFAGRAVERCPVSRVDGPWVHGRDHNRAFPYLAKRRVAVVGCGSLGAAICRLLAQAGVGNFLLIDADFLEPSNTSRHVLGQRFLGKNKASATAAMLNEDFPHIANAIAMPGRFSDLRTDELDRLGECDILISAGITYEGDAQIDRWRQRLSKPPAQVCAWVEEFAIVGHAVALLGKDTLSDAFDEQERVRFRLTDWPTPSQAMIVEAGCGNSFQPHGAIDLQATVNIAAGLALDVIAGLTSVSLRRVWLGNRSDVANHGGIALPQFTESFCRKEFPWH